MVGALQRMPLVLQTALLTLVLSAVTWVALDALHNRQLKALFREQLMLQLERQSAEDRLFLDRYIRSHHQVAKLFTQQPALVQYLQARAPGGGKPRLSAPGERASWWPSNALLRIFAQPRFVLLLDSEARVREVWRSAPQEPPASLFEADALLRKLSHEEGLLTRVGDSPYLLSLGPVRTGGRLLGYVLLATPMDGEFLFAAQKPGGADNITALVSEDRVLASNRPDLIASSRSLEPLGDRYVVTGKSYFDYGSSDLRVAFVSIRPVAELEALNSELVEKERRQRALGAAVLIAAFLLVVLWVRSRVQRLAAGVATVSREVLGTRLDSAQRGDELSRLETIFARFRDEIVRSREALARAVEEKTRKGIEAEQQTRLARLLQEVSETLGIGVLGLEDGNAEARNSIMQRFLDDMDGAAVRFEPEPGCMHEERTLTDRRGRRRVFELRRPPGGGSDYLLVEDVSERREVERRLQLSAEVIDNSTEGLFIAAADGRLELANPAFGSISGLPVQAGQTGLDAVVADPELSQLLWYSLAENGGWQGEFDVSRGGTVQRLWLRVDAVRDAGGRVLSYVGALSDVTERHEAQETLRRYARELEERNEEVRGFAYIVSHDLRAPLVNIRGFVSELNFTLREVRALVDGAAGLLPEAERTQLEQAFAGDIPEALEYIGAGVKRMDGLIAAILKLSRLGRRELRSEPLDLGVLVQEILDGLRYQLESRGSTVRVGELPALTADRQAMQQVLANVITNAVNYLDPERPGDIAIWGEREEAGCVLHVRDNGRGIAVEDQGKVFAVFRRGSVRDVPGEGMGLAYVQALVRRHGGQIDFDSEPGSGTTFHIIIPDVLPEERGGGESCEHTAKTA